MELVLETGVEGTVSLIKSVGKLHLRKARTEIEMPNIWLLLLLEISLLFSSPQGKTNNNKTKTTNNLRFNTRRQRVHNSCQMLW